MALLLMGCARQPPAHLPEEVLAGFLDLPSARAWYVRARAAELRGDLVEAERGMRWVTRLDRRTSAGALHVGAFHERQGRPDEAADAYRRAVARAADDAERSRAQVALGRALVDLGDPEGPELLGGACPGPGCAPAVEVAIGVGDVDSAVELLGRWRDAEPTPEAARERAAHAAAIGRWGDAVDEWLIVLQAGPTAEDVVAATRAAEAAGDPRVAAWLERTAR